MNIPPITEIIRRRILLNYKIVPEAAQAVLPEPLPSEACGRKLPRRHLPDSAGGDSSQEPAALYRQFERSALMIRTPRKARFRAANDVASNWDIIDK